MTDGPVSLREFIAAHEEDHERRHIEHAVAHDRQHEADQRAIRVATDILERRLDGLNELRKLVGDQQANFAPIISLDRLDTETDRRINELREQVGKLVNANERAQGALAIARFVGASGLLSGLAALVWVIINGSRP